MNEGKEEKKSNTLKKVLIVLLILLLLFGTLLAGGYFYIKNKIKETVEYIDIDENDIEINDELSKEKNIYKNIAILGLDSGDNKNEKKSDCIIIASLNDDTKEIKIVSVYCDLYLQIGDELDRINNAYLNGGAQNTLNALNRNLDLDITEFVTVDFGVVADAVDALGGVDINIESNEIDYLNECITSTAKKLGTKSKLINESGTQTLNGVQAVAYARIRNEINEDNKRTEKMRTVINEILRKTKTKSVSEITEIMEMCLSKISTNISPDEIIKMIPDLLKYKIVKGTSWPYEYKVITLDKWYYVPITLEESVSNLHEFLFKKIDYIPSQTVKDISQSIIDKTGINN